MNTEKIKQDDDEHLTHTISQILTTDQALNFSDLLHGGGNSVLNQGNNVTVSP